MMRNNVRRRQRKANPHRPSVSFKELCQALGIFDSITIAVVVEVNPSGFSSALSYALSPDPQLGVAIIVPIPLFDSVKADINVIRGAHQFIG